MFKSSGMLVVCVCVCVFFFGNMELNYLLTDDSVQRRCCILTNPGSADSY